MTPDKRAFEAKQVLDNPVFEETMQRIKQASLDGLSTANLSDVDNLRARVAMFQACTEFESALKTQIYQGEIEDKIEQEVDEKPPWFKRILSRQVHA